MIVSSYLYVAGGSLRTIWRFRLRSSLLLLSAMLGVAGVVTAASYARSGRLTILSQLRRLGTNVVIVTPAQSRSVGNRARTGAPVTTLVERDDREIRRAVPDIVRASATASGTFLVKAGDLAKSNCVVMGIAPDYMRIKQWTTAEGQMFEDGDLRRGARVAVLGATVRQDLFGTRSPIGQRIFINRVPFAVVGAMAARGQGLDASDEDAHIYVPLNTALHRVMNVASYSGLIFEVSSWERMDDASTGVREVLRRRHHTVAPGPEDFQVQNQKTLIDTAIVSAARLEWLVRSAALSGLVVSGLGVLATSWIALRARVIEIGTRRALGATRSDILVQFLFEAVTVSLLGGLAGLAVGWDVSRIVADRVRLPSVFDWPVARFALASSLGLNLLCSLVPACRAARLDPLDALKRG